MCMQLSARLALTAADADLIILEGMGRGIETNLHARFSVDSLKLGMIKHREVRASPVCISHIHVVTRPTNANLRYFQMLSLVR